MNSQLPKLIADLMEPSAIDQSNSPTPKLIQTHISWVILFDDVVYKLKKPYNLGFLDFSDFQQRKYFIEEEFRLNHLISPSLYSEVLPVYKDQEGHYFYAKPGTEICEYALKMKRFSTDLLFSRLISEKKVSEKMAIDLARNIASFHLNPAHALERDYNFGSPEQISSILNEIFDITSSFARPLHIDKELSETENNFKCFLNKNDNIFRKRLKENKIKSCHGDLHLNNICWFEGTPTLFDCIEFSEKYRNIDVLYDLSFLLMDLHFHGENEIASTILNEYLEQTGDYEGIQLLPFYLSMRAMVRVKVTAIQLEDASISSQQKEDAKKTALAYFKLAKGYWISKEKYVAMMCGLSGSGKSTVGKILMTKKNAIILRTDVIRKHLTQTPLEEKGLPEIYSILQTKKTYAVVVLYAQQLLDAGFSVIIDGTFLKKWQRETIINEVFPLANQAEIIHCVAPLSLLEKWIRDRKNDVSDASVEVLHQQVKTFDPFDSKEQSYLREIQTDKRIVL